jgi:predicted Zn-dependent protease
VEAALTEYEAAHAEQPDSAELAFWHGVALAANGREQEARPLLDRAYAQGEGWRELLRRLPEAGLFPDDQELVTRMTLSGRQDVTAAPSPPPGGGPS